MGEILSETRPDTDSDADSEPTRISGVTIHRYEKGRRPRGRYLEAYGRVLAELAQALDD
jgi:hypothetical protein